MLLRVAAARRELEFFGALATWGQARVRCGVEVASCRWFAGEMPTDADSARVPSAELVVRARRTGRD